MQLLVATGAALLAFVPLGVLARRSVFELPVLAIAVVYAAFGHGPRVDVGPLSLSEPGLEVAIAVLAKATIGIVAVSAVAATTTATELVRGLRRLRFPVWFCDLVAVASRQVEVLREEAAACPPRRPSAPAGAGAATSGAPSPAPSAACSCAAASEPSGSPPPSLSARDRAGRAVAVWS